MRALNLLYLGCSFIFLLNLTALGSGSCRIAVGNNANTIVSTEDSCSAKKYEPVLYWGTNSSGDVTFRGMTCFYAKFPTDVPINEKFSVQSLELAFDGKITHISGSCLTEEVHIKVRNATPGETMYCEAYVKDERGTVHRISGKWVLR